MNRILILLGAVVVVAACDRPATAPLKLDPKSASECIWIRSGDTGDSTEVCG